MSTQLPNFKKFISEDDIAEAKKKRQEEWERVRRPDQPEEAPEEEYDPRSLFERLEANRVKKQEEYDEAHRMKNMVRGLENEEVEFLEKVSIQKEQEEQEKMMEEKLLLAEYKSSLVYDRTKEDELNKSTKPVKMPSYVKAPMSQKALLAGVIKRKGSSSDDTTAQPAKAPKVTESKVTESKVTESSQEIKPATLGNVLPGLGSYTDSDSSSNSNSGE